MHCGFEEQLSFFERQSTTNHVIIRKIECYLPSQFIRIEEQKTLKLEPQRDLLFGALESLATQIKELIIILDQ